MEKSAPAAKSGEEGGARGGDKGGRGGENDNKKGKVGWERRLSRVEAFRGWKWCMSRTTTSYLYYFLYKNEFQNGVLCDGLILLTGMPPFL